MVMFLALAALRSALPTRVRTQVTATCARERPAFSPFATRDFRPVVGNSYVQKACALESAAGTSTRAVTWLPVREVWEIAIGSFGSRSSVNSRLYFAGVAADESESPVHHQL
jgi:hypothetical protein